ncbi:hypothetical protein [Anaeromicropila herbilytica]|uniref:Uncharacterized protein n=1 Tax=Anaeromicropila herbilytica TaxID=2785025 RepID=A0A7R7EKN7_9FIRM|nr:hypothetical protein [Anaeromicropila herbilytica]BCN30212.1 hypothetical protein bsdtb5_15070 [Anaeromicropila herbilytica]
MSKQSNQRYRKELDKKNSTKDSVTSKGTNAGAKNNSPDGDYAAPSSSTIK